MPHPAAAARTETIFYQNQPLTYELHFRARRTLGLLVRPDGRVQVNAPRQAPLAWVAEQVRRKAPWILKHQAAFRLRPAATPAPAEPTAAGAVYFFLGQPYRLTLLTGRLAGVARAETELWVTTPTPPTPAQLQALLVTWYQQQAAAQFARALEQVWPLFAEFDLPRPTLLVRAMRTRWGSCTPRTGRIRLSRDLVRASPGCIAYVLLHECCHLLVPDHSAAFYALQTRLLPDWPRWKQELNALPK